MRVKVGGGVVLEGAAEAGVGSAVLRLTVRLRFFSGGFSLTDEASVGPDGTRGGSGDGSIAQRCLLSRRQQSIDRAMAPNYRIRRMRIKLKPCMMASSSTL